MYIGRDTAVSICSRVVCTSMLWMYVCLTLYTSVTMATVVPDEQRLSKKIFTDQKYDKTVRPVYNSSKNVEVVFGFTLIQIMDMDEKNQVLIINAWLDMTWNDERIRWNKDDYNGLDVIRVPAKKLWLPDIVLYNNADDYTSGFMPINAYVFHDGTIAWSPPVRLQLSCKVDITYFPFDHQVCKLKFGSWTYDKAQVDLLNKTGEVDVSGYITNGEWMLTRYRITRNEVVYPISPAIYPDVTVILTIQRRVLYYVLNILFPCFWLNLLSILTFCLPPDAGEKLTLSITVLLSYSVFMLLVADSMPPTSEFVPLIGVYLTMSMAVASVAVILTVVVLKLHHCAPNQKPIPDWVRRYVLGILARLVRCSCKTPCLYQVNRLRRRRHRSSTISDTTVPEREEQYISMNGSVGHQLDTLAAEMSTDSMSLSLGDNLMLDFLEDNPEKRNLMFPEVYASLKPSEVLNRSETKLEKLEQVMPSADSPSQKTLEAIAGSINVLVDKLHDMDSESNVEDEWKQVALVADRLFFWLFLFTTMFSTVVILVIIPAFKVTEEGLF